MKKIMLISIALLALLASCKVETQTDLGPETTRTMSVKEFSSLNLAIATDVEYIPSDTFSVTITAPEKQMDRISVDQSAGTLTICANSASTPGVIWIVENNGPAATKIVVRAPRLTQVSVAGSGSLVCKNTLKTPHIDFAIAGSGSISIDSLEAQSITLNTHGSGSITARTLKVDQAAVAIMGSGNIDAGLTQASSVNATIGGSGYVSMALTDCGHVEAAITGSGAITLSGTAQTLEQNISGSGNIDTDNLKLAK